MYIWINMYICIYTFISFVGLFCEKDLSITQRYKLLQYDILRRRRRPILPQLKKRMQELLFKILFFWQIFLFFPIFAVFGVWNVVLPAFPWRFAAPKTLPNTPKIPLLNPTRRTNALLCVDPQFSRVRRFANLQKHVFLGVKRRTIDTLVMTWQQRIKQPVKHQNP